MAQTPPVTIGELTDVPAVGSSVAAGYHQEIANRVVQRFATIAVRDTKWPAATAGRNSLCVTNDGAVPLLWVSDGTYWQPVLAEQRPVTFTTGGETSYNGPATYDLLTVIPPGSSGLPYPTQVQVTACFKVGFGGAGAVDVVCRLYQFANGAAADSYVNTPAGKWSNATVSWAWDVPAMGQLAFKTQINISTTGNCYGSCFGTYRITRKLLP